LLNTGKVTNGNGSVRIVQRVANANFDVAAKFDSAPTSSYQGEGILVQQDSGTYCILRSDTMAAES
jgi:hypothetical protein